MAKKNLTDAIKAEKKRKEEEAAAAAAAANNANDSGNQ